MEKQPEIIESMTLSMREYRSMERATEDEARIDILSHLVGNNYIDTYDCKEVLDCYSIEPHELKKYTLTYHDDETTEEYFKELYYECGLLCDECEEEYDSDQVCQNTECFMCDDAYLTEEEIEARQ